MADLRFDCQELAIAAKEYEDLAKSMAELKEKLENNITQLVGTSWQSGAGKAFEEKFKENWNINVKKHISALLILAEIIKKVEEEYAALEEEANQLNIGSV